MPLVRNDFETFITGYAIILGVKKSLGLIKASGDSFEIGGGRILIYSSIGVQNSIF